MPLSVLSLTTIYPNERFRDEGRSVAFLDRALAELGVHGTTLVLKPWMPRVIAANTRRWRHLAVEPRIEERGDHRVVFARYLHVPHRYGLDLPVRGMTKRALALIRRHRWQVDVVHGQSIFPAALAARNVARALGVPFIVTLRDDLSHLADLQRRSARTLDPFMEMFESAGAIFAHGPALVRDLSATVSPVARDRVFLAANGVDHRGLESMLRALPPRAPREVPEVVSVGHLYRYKGMHESLRALRVLCDRGIRNFRYTIVGDGPYRAELEGLAKELELGEQVTFRGRLPHEGALAAMRDADIFCLASWAEPFGNVYAEAAVCAKPVIACAGFGGELSVQDGSTGLLVKPRDIGSLAAALEKLITDPELARTMGERGREHVRQLTWERTARLYRDAIAEVAHVRS